MYMYTLVYTVRAWTMDLRYLTIALGSRSGPSAASSRRAGYLRPARGR